MSAQDRIIQFILLAVALIGAGMMIFGFVLIDDTSIGSPDNPIHAIGLFLLKVLLVLVNLSALALTFGGGTIFVVAFTTWYRRQNRLIQSRLANATAAPEKEIAAEGPFDKVGNNLQPGVPIAPAKLSLWATGIFGLGLVVVNAASFIAESRGEVQAERQRFQDTRPEGPFTVYYPTGEKRVEGHHDAMGYIQGKVTIWYASGEKKRELHVSNGMLYIDQYARQDFAEEIRDVFIRPNTKFKAKYEGPFIDWYENGQRKIETNYTGGQKTGPSTLWYESGKLKSEQHFREDQLDGASKWWFEDGQLAMEDTFVMGRPSGVSKSWWPDGKRLSEKTHMADGRSTWTYWHQNGEREFEVSFIDTHREGVYTRTHRLNIGDSAKRSPRFYLEKQTIISTPDWGPGRYHGPWTLWYETGQLRMQQFWDKGKENGVCTYWYGKGQKKYEVKFREGELDGLVRQWYESGQLKSERITKAGKSHGHSRLWFENGQMKWDVSYIEGIREPDGKQWDEAGNEMGFDRESSYNYNPC